MNRQIEQLLVEKETGMYAAYQRHDMAAIEALLADDFHEIGSSGRFYSKADVLNAMNDIRVLNYSVTKIQVLPLDENSAVVTYILDVRRIENEKECLNRAFRSSLWRNRNGEWRIVFHQATPLVSR